MSRSSTLALATIATTLCFAAPAAEAKGCIKGALVGGLAGHAVGHGIAGAAAGFSPSCCAANGST